MKYWYVEKNRLHEGSNVVPDTATSWGLMDERGVYHFRTEDAAQKYVDDYPRYNLKRIGTITGLIDCSTS